jgi:benzoyl-CoA reductase subunit D
MPEARALARSAGIDLGSSAVKVAVIDDFGDGDIRLLACDSERIRKRDPIQVTEEIFERTLRRAQLERTDLDYIATTGEGEQVTFRTGHFYGMTAHARGALFLEPEALAAIDIGALHTRAILMNERGKVLGYRMTSQCASGSGQFLENIGRYLGVTLEEIGPLSLQSQNPEVCSSICAVLAETDVINMVSRGIRVPDILRGIHQSMAGRTLRLLTSAKAKGVVLVTGGLAADVGLVQALREAAKEQGAEVDVRAHERSVLAGALGAAIWGAYRSRKLRERGMALSA